MPLLKKVLTFPLLFSSFLSIFACSRAEEPQNQLQTALIDSDKISATFKRYQAKAEHCHQNPGIPSVVLTGFNRFGKPFNISGLVAMSMAKPEFWPDVVDLTRVSPEDTDLSQFAQHSELQTSEGALVKQRTLVINDKKYEVCFLYLDVQWDLAASIIVHESQLMQAQLVIMSGMNGAAHRETTWETEALNLAGMGGGFDAFGHSDPNNSPIELTNPILPDDALGQTIRLSWKAAELARLNAPLIASIAPNFSTITGVGRTSNDYVCNNVSYVVQQGLSGHHLSLASGQIQMTPPAIHGVQVGFLHYPADASEAGLADNGLALFRWNQVLAQSIDASLNHR